MNMEKGTAGTLYSENETSFKALGRYSTATFEDSTLVVGSLLQRGVHSVKNGASLIAAPFQKSGKVIKQNAEQATAPVKCLGGQINKLFIPFRWSARKLADAGNRGLPVHLDRETLGSIRQGLSRIEERLARIEEKGIAFAQAPHHPGADDFKEKPTKQKNMLFRAILEESKGTLASETLSE